MKNELLRNDPALKKSLSKLSKYEVKRIFHKIFFGWIKPRRILKQKTKTTIFIWTMLALPILNLLIFWFYVNVDSILMAFRNIDPKTGREIWTLNNFKEIGRMFSGQDPETDMVRYGLNTLIYWLIGTVWSIPHSILLTYVFHKKLRGTKFFRVVLYLPTIICAVVMAVMFNGFVSGSGVLGVFYKEVLHKQTPAWFNDGDYANGMLYFYAFFFGFAGQFILFSGAMAKISKEVQEAAILDGVTMWEELWYIYIPLMWPTLSMTIVTSFAGIFGATGSILLFTPELRDTYTFGYWIYDQVLESGQSFCYVPAALGLVFTVIAYPLCLGVRKLVTSVYQDAE